MNTPTQVFHHICVYRWYHKVGWESFDIFFVYQWFTDSVKLFYDYCRLPCLVNTLRSMPQMYFWTKSSKLKRLKWIIMIVFITNEELTILIKIIKWIENTLVAQLNSLLKKVSNELLKEYWTGQISIAWLIFFRYTLIFKKMNLKIPNHIGILFWIIYTMVPKIKNLLTVTIPTGP